MSDTWPYDAVPFAELIARQADAYGDKVYASFDDGAEDVTFAGIAEDAWRSANALRDLGVSVGATVASWQPNGRAAIRDFFGNMAAGSVHTPLNVSYRGRLLEHAINLSGCSVLLAHPELVARLADLELPHLRYVVTRTDEAPASRLGTFTVLDERDLAAAPATPTAVRLGSWDPMAMVLTSGTTGPSKGVLQSYAYYEVLAKNYIGDLGPTDRYYHCLPPFHQGALVAMYAMFRDGGSIYARDGFRAADFWPEVRRTRSTAALLIGGMANLLMKQPAAADDRDNPLRVTQIVPLIPHFREFETRFDVSVSTCYGMTEIGTPFTSAAPDNGTTCGTLTDGYEVRLVDEHDLPVPDGQPGELLVRHDLTWALNSGYKDLPEATATAWRNGWFHTGDAFRREPDGNFYYVDRMKDVIRRRGENISSLELEREILAHPAVLEAAVIGVTAEHADEEVLAVVVPRPGHGIDFHELTEFLIPRLPHYMVPRYLRTADELPKTATNKVRKDELRRLPLDSEVWDRETAGYRLRRDVLTPRVGS